MEGMERGMEFRERKEEKLATGRHRGDRSDRVRSSAQNRNCPHAVSVIARPVMSQRNPEGILGGDWLNGK